MKIQLALPSLHEAQQKIFDSPARFKIAYCGRRFGKTRLAAIMVFQRIVFRQQKCLWVGPDYQRTEDGWKYLKDLFATLPFPPKPNESKFRIRYGRGEVRCGSADDPDSLRGKGLDFVVLDEAAWLKADTWHRSLRPSLLGRGGEAFMISTPRGRNWLYRLWLKGVGGSDEFESFQFSSWANKAVDQAEVERIRDDGEMALDAWREEYEAEPMEDASSYFRNVRAHIRDGFESYLGEHKRYVIGWDVAKFRDYSVVIVLDCDTGHAVLFDRMQKIDYSIQIRRVIEISRIYGFAPVMVDSTGVGDPILETLKMSIPAEGFLFTNRTKQDVIEHLALEMQRGCVSYPNIPVLIAELEAFRYELTTAGNVRYSAPEGAHDDCVIALALAVWNRRHGIYASRFRFAREAPKPERATL